MATHFRTLAWRIPWTEEPLGLQPWGHRESDEPAGLTLSLEEAPQQALRALLC